MTGMNYGVNKGSATSTSSKWVNVSLFVDAKEKWNLLATAFLVPYFIKKISMETL